MGQSASTARDPRDTGYSEGPTPPSTERDPDTRGEDMDNRQTSDQIEEASQSTGNATQQHDGEIMTSSHPHEPPGDWQQPRRSSQGLQQMRSIEEENDSEYGLAESEYRSAALVRMAARRQSTMSRLGSRILPNSVIRGLLSSQEETPAEGRAHRHGLVSRTTPRSETAHSSGRFSPFSALGSRGITRRRSSRSPYVLPSRADSSVIANSTTDSFVDTSGPQAPEPSRASWRQSARLHRMRHSLSMPISHIFGQPQPGMSSPREGVPQAGPSFDDHFPSAMDTRLDFGEPLPELDSVEPGTSQAEPSPSDQSNAGLAGMRRLPELLRARSARALRREEQTPLSRVLQLAAAAIAAQLSGSNGPAMPNIQALGNQGVDGSLENFIQSLQHATSGQAQPTPPGEGPSNPGNEGSSPPVNFLRVFRFANADSTPGRTSFNPSGRNPNHSASAASDGMPVDEPAEGGEGRTVTLVVVGVRSVSAGNGSNGEPGAPAPGGPGLDALLGLPFLPPNAVPRPQVPTGDLSQRPDGILRPQAPRPAGRQGHVQISSEENSRRLVEAGLLPPRLPYPRPAIPHLFSDSPPGPHPPPSTPAEHGMSTAPSGSSTPSRRPSSASATPPNTLPNLHEGQAMPPAVEPVEESIPTNAARQRRRSDSEYARHRAFGSGSVRRNGVVEPDQPPPSGGRSWLIYVVGTNLAENHPALTTPSLFTDVCNPFIRL